MKAMMMGLTAKLIPWRSKFPEGRPIDRFVNQPIALTFLK